MANVRYPIKLNVKPSQYPLIRNITLVQGDTANVFSIQLTDGNTPFNIENCYITGTFKKSDDNVVIVEGEIVDATNGLVDIPVFAQALAYPGEVLCTVEVYNENKQRLTSIMFQFNVIKQLGKDEDITSTTEYTILQQLIDSVTKFEENAREAEQIRQQNENEREQNEINRQIQFDNIINTANTTKSGLDSSISTGNILKTDLDNNISTGTELNNNLEDNITEGNQLKTDLLPLISDANTAKSNLDGSIATSVIKKIELDESIIFADSIKRNLDTSISSANNINNILSNATTGTIKRATDANSALNTSIENSSSSKTALDGSITTANTSKSNLDASVAIANGVKADLNTSISTANVIKTALDDSITEGNNLKDDLEQIISGTDYEQIIIDINNLKQDQHNHANKDTLDGLSDVDGKLKYNGQDVGIGDMVKSTYDKNNDGIVDVAETVIGNEIQLGSYKLVYNSTTNSLDIEVVA